MIRATRGGLGPLRVAARVRLLKNAKPILIRQEDDPDPRFVLCEEGPERIALRTLYSLIDHKGVYHGDGLTDTILYADGEVRLAFALRLVDNSAHDTVTDAWVEVQADGNVRSVCPGTRKGERIPTGALTTPRSYRFGRALPGRSVVLEGARGAAALGWYSDDGRETDRLGGAGLWHGPRDRSPYYDTWGHLYDQWRGSSGWGGHKTGRLVLAAEDDATTLAWHWLHDAEEPVPETMGFRAMLGLFLDAGAAVAGRRIDALQAPVIPAAEGAQFRCLDVVENALLYKKTAPEMTVTFPRDRLERRVHLRVFGLEGGGSVVAEVGGRRVVPHVLALGGMTDDPYGPNLARPGDRFMPVIGDAGEGPCHAVLSVPLSARKKTAVTLREEPGIGLAYVKWDDRQTYVIRASSVPAGPVATFSTRTLCLHDLRGAKGAGPALIRVPFYWYPTNVATRGECVNELRRLRMTASGPDRLGLEITSTDPNRRARTVARVEIPAPREAVTVRVDTRLEVLTELDLPSIQYLNSFPSNSWQPEDWPDDWVVLATSDGRRMCQFFKEPRGRRQKWDDIRTWKGRLCFVQGAAARGNIFILAESRRPRGQSNGYMLCPVWLDSHFTFEGLRAPLKAGTVLAAAYTVGVHGDGRLTRAEAEEVAAAAARSGTLPFG